MVKKASALTAAERLQEASLLAQQARGSLWDKISPPGLIVAVIIKTLDGTAIEVMVNLGALEGSDIGTGPLVKALHAAVEGYAEKLPSLVKLPAEKPS
jgi:hypothetical protein